VTATREESNLFGQFIQANELGVRLEIVRGLPMWEAHPVMKHQRAIDRIRGSIEPRTPAVLTACQCIHVSDVYVRFPDGSLKRPDVAIFCREPPRCYHALLRRVPVGLRSQHGHAFPTYVAQQRSGATEIALLVHEQT
jgi:hypothetical protein